MANPIKTNSVQGLYILVDQGGWVAANTPGEADLSALTLGTTYIYFGSLIRLEYVQTSNYENENFRGWRTWPSGEGKMDANTGFHERSTFAFQVEETLTNTEYTEFFHKYYNRSTSWTTRIYLVRQYASESFRQFANNTPALKKYLPIVIRSVVSVETGNTNKQNITVSGEVIWG